VDFVQLQREAAQYLESNFREQTVVTVWPLSTAIRHPDLGYVDDRLRTRVPAGLRLPDLQAVQPGPGDVIVVYSRGQAPRGRMLQIPGLRNLAAQFAPLRPEASSEEVATLGFTSRARWTRGEQWIEIYAPSSQPK
jgi:hypothetical protein